MRLLFALLLLFGAGCSSNTLTISGSQIARYAAREKVPTAEGVMLSLDDGGAVEPVPVAGGSFRVIARQSLQWEGGTRDMVYLGDRVGGEEAPGELIAVRDVVQIEHGGTVTILGRRSGVRVSTAYVGGLRVSGSRHGGKRGLSGGAIAGIVVGSAAAAGLIIGLAIFAAGEVDLGINF